MNTANAQEVLSIKGVSKGFPGVQALSGVNFQLLKGEVHALLGENGAGKSTLMKILSGALQKDEGEIRIEGEVVNIQTPGEAENHGVAIIYQEFNLIPGLTVAENIFLHRYPRKNGMVDWKQMRENAKKALDQIQCTLQTEQIVSELTTAEQQMVEIAKATSLNAKILVMDEPTSSLSEGEANKLFSVVKLLSQKNVGIIFITHKMDEVFQICDRATILRDGCYITTETISNLTLDNIIEYMVGRPMENVYPPKTNKIGDVFLEVKDLTDGGRKVKPCSFFARKGEILGFAGLVGAGRTELMRLVFGVDKKAGGKIYINGKAIEIDSPKTAIRNKIGLVPEDRRRQGLVLSLSVRHNIVMANMQRAKKKFYLSPSKEKEISQKYISDLIIKTPTQMQVCKLLSGGNQQKVVIAKWLNSDPDIIIMDEPTRGIDVNAKYEIYNIIIRLAEQGKVMIIVSSELPELIGVCDRIMVMHEGTITGELGGANMTQKKIMYLATGEGEDDNDNH